MKKRILIAAEEINLRARVARLLQSAGYSVELADNENRARKLALNHKFNIAIVAPSPSLGVSMLQELRDTIPKILVLAERTDEITHLSRSLSGADAFLLKSSSNEELVDRLAKMMAFDDTAQNEIASAPTTLCIEDRRLDLAAHVFVDADGHELPLTRAEAALLKELARGVREVRSRDQLRHAVAGRGADPFDRSVDMLVARLRHKIEPDPRAPRFIITVPGVGYKLMARLQSAEKQISGAKPTECERRQLTVLSCNLVGSAALVAHCDPEDLSSVIRDFQASGAAVIERMGGTIATLTADAILAYFGYPESSEHDAERAVHAGLDLVAKVGQLVSPTGGPLQARVGIATGIAVVSPEQAIGEPIAVAAGLCNAAAPNSVLVAASTRKLLGGTFVFENMEQYRIAESNAVSACHVVGERRIESRFKARRSHEITQLIGRDQELRQLSALWDRVKRWEGQVVLVSGEPGIGKSHLCEAFMDRISYEPHATIQYQCSPYRRNSPFYPIISQLEQAIGLEQSDTPEIKLEKLNAALSQAVKATQNDTLSYADLLSIKTPVRKPALGSTPKQNKDRMIAALTRHLLDIARQQPLIIVLADAHWIDSSTLELVDRIIPSIKAARVLVLIKFRPEFCPRWLGTPHVTTLSLDRLGRDESRAIISRVSGGKELPREIQEQILSKTEGVPLFVEELTMSVLESGLVKDAGCRYVAAVDPLPAFAIPATLLGSLTARLDRLGPAREIAQIGAVAGREFRYELLRTVAGLPTQKLDEALDQLVRSELVFCWGEIPDAVYTFKHALVRDAAYAGLLKSRRVHLHAAIANALEQEFPEVARTQPEIVAYHYTQASSYEKALHYWYEAGKQSAARSAHNEAVGHLNQALKQIPNIDDPVLRNKYELLLQTSLGKSLRATKGWSTDSVKHAYTRALQLCKETGLDEHTFPAVFGLWTWNFVRPALGEAQALAEHLLSTAENVDDSVRKVLAHEALGFTLFAQGKFDTAHAELERSISLCEDSKAAVYLDLSAQDPRVHVRSYDSMALWFLGYPDQALRICAEARRYADASQHPFSEAMERTISLRVHQLRGEAAVVASRVNAAIALCQEHEFGHYLAMALILRGWARAQQGEFEKGIAEIQEGLEKQRATGALLYESYTLGLLADACIKNERYGQALEFLDQAQLRLDEKNSERFYAAEIYRLLGETHLRSQQDLDQAELYFSKGLKVAREQKAKSLELKLCLSIYDLYEQRQNADKYRSGLGEIYGSFSEGFSAPDLVRAKARLEIA